MSGRAAGHFNMPTPIIPTSTTPLSSRWRWTARRASGPEYKAAIARAREWIEGLQSANGGWGAFDSDNDREYLNYIPFADHGALLDPPTADVTARCVSMLGQLGETPASNPAVARGVEYLLRNAGEGRQLVRPLGDELHLWNLVGALRV